jgi:hypothetical protein
VQHEKIVRYLGATGAVVVSQINACVYIGDFAFSFTTTSPVTNSPCAVPAEIAACLARPATNEAQATVHAWLKNHEYDCDFWIHFPEKTASDICRWVQDAERWPYMLGGPVWGILCLTAAVCSSIGVVRNIDLGGPLTIGLGVLTLLGVLFGGVLFAVEVLAKPWGRLCDCEHADSLRLLVAKAGKDDIEELYIEVEDSAEAVKYLDEVGKRRKYVANDFRIAQKLTPGYIPLFDI